MMRAIAAWKDRHLTGLTPTFANLLLKVEPRLSISEPLQIVTPPQRSQAFAIRGFNSIAKLAQEICKINNVIFYDQNAIRYKRQPQDQRSLSLEGRRQNVFGVFEINQLSDLPILILDDVWTTGSTLRELAATIANPKQVCSLLVLSTAYKIGSKEL